MGANVLAERLDAKEACVSHGLKPIDPAMGEGIHPARVVDLSMSYDQMKSFVEKDEYAVRHCDALIVLTGDTPSEGTGQEIAIAYALHKPIVMVAPKRKRGALMGFWNVKASAIVDTVWDAAEYLAENYGMGEI